MAKQKAIKKIFPDMFSEENLIPLNIASQEKRLNKMNHFCLFVVYRYDLNVLINKHIAYRDKTPENSRVTKVIVNGFV